MTEPPAKPLPGRLADFEVVQRLGAGGMAEVLLAKKRGAERTYKLLVLKRILPTHGFSQRFRAMFAEEAQLATRLNHPNIVQVYDFQDYGEEGQLLSMEYVEGLDLRKLMRAARARGQRLPPYVSAYIIAEVAKGLHYAHERKDEAGKPLDIVHRDVSPQNILLSFEGAAKIADFGIASANLFREEPGILKGKTAYMSPEQARGEKAARQSDIYSLGIVFYELLAGRPLRGTLDGVELLEAARAGHLEAPSTYVRELPNELEDIAMRALAVNPQDRFPTAREMALAIGSALLLKQKLVDAHDLELVIAEFVPRPELAEVQEFKGPPPEDSHPISELPQSAASLATGFTEHAADGQTGPGHRISSFALRKRPGREVRHVAVVSVRLHGFATLEQAIGRLPATRILDQLRATLGEVAFRRGGRWLWSSPEAQGSSDLGPELGRAIVGLVENPARAPLDAAWLATDVHEVLRAASEDLPVRLAASVGIARGIATGTRDHDGHLISHELQETAPYLAELLRDRAPANCSWVAGGVYRLVRREFVWRDAPAMNLEGEDHRELPQDMRIYELLRPHTRDERMEQLPFAPSDLVGRDAELADLQAAFYSAIGPAPGQLSVRVLYGEMGIGKTALLTAFLSEVGPSTRVLHLECSPARSEVPFAMLSDGLRTIAGTDPERTPEGLRSAVLQALGELEARDEITERIVELASGHVRPAADEADVLRSRGLIVRGLCQFMAHAARDLPLVIAIDGLQWADRPSLELLAEILHKPQPVPVLYLLLTRPDERVQPFVEGFLRVELSGLTSDQQVQLLNSRLGVSSGVRQACADLLVRAAGNPFFLLEMVDALLERGALQIRERDGEQQELVEIDPGAQALRALPQTLEQLIGDRLSELPSEEQVIIEWLSVAGGPLGIRDLTELSGGDVSGPVARLCARGLCDPKSDAVDVRHPLTRDVAYRALERRRRAWIHRRLGEHLRNTPLAQGLTAALVARHLAKGGADDLAADLYLEAAHAARQSQQVYLAKRCYRRAVLLLKGDDLRLLEAHEALESICRNQGRSYERRQHLLELRRLSRRTRGARWIAIALLRTAQFELDAGRLRKALLSARRAQQVAAHANTGTLEVQAHTLLCEILQDIGDMRGALSAVDRALDSSKELCIDARLYAEALRLRGALLGRAGRVHEAVEAHVEAVAVARASGAGRLEARAKNSLAYSLLVLGRFEDAIALALEAIRADLAVGERFQVAKTLSTIGVCYANLGDLDRGLAYLRRAREAHERCGDRDSRADTLLWTAEVLLETGDTGAADELVGDAGALAAVTGSTFDLVHEKILRALLARAVAEPDRAAAHAFEARQTAEAQAYVAFHFHAMAIEACSRVETGELHTGILLATTALGAIETLQGSEYGLTTRALCCEALLKGHHPQSVALRSRAVNYVRALQGFIRDPAHRELFSRRQLVQRILNETEA